MPSNFCPVYKFAKCVLKSKLCSFSYLCVGGEDGVSCVNTPAPDPLRRVSRGPKGPGPPAEI